MELWEEDLLANPESLMEKELGGQAQVVGGQLVGGRDGGGVGLL